MFGAAAIVPGNELYLVWRKAPAPGQIDPCVEPTRRTFDLRALSVPVGRLSLSRVDGSLTSLRFLHLDRTYFQPENKLPEMYGTVGLSSVQWKSAGDLRLWILHLRLVWKTKVLNASAGSGGYLGKVRRTFPQRDQGP